MLMMLARCGWCFTNRLKRRLYGRLFSIAMEMIHENLNNLQSMLLRKCHDMVHQFPTIENIISNRQLESLKSQMSFRLSVVHQKSKPRVRNSQIQCTWKVHVYSCKCVVSVTFVYWHSSSGYEHIGPQILAASYSYIRLTEPGTKSEFSPCENRKKSKNFSWNILE